MTGSRSSQFRATLVAVSSVLLALGNPIGAAAEDHQLPPAADSVGSLSQDDVRFRLEFGFPARPAEGVMISSESLGAFGAPLTNVEAADLQRRLELRDKLDTTLDLVSAHDEELGGHWIDYSKGGLDVHVVAVPRTTAALREAIEAMLPSGVGLHWEVGTHTWSQLRSQRDAVFAPESGVVFAYPDPRVGAVVVGVADDSVSVPKTHGSDVEVRVGVTDELETVACPSRTQCTSPWRGGTQIISQAGPGPYQCTWGFVGRPETTATSSTRYVITAGHCNFLGGGFTHNGASVTTATGTSRNTFDFGPGTVRSDSLRANMRTMSGAHNTIMRSAAVPSHAITAYRSLSTTSVGDAICYSGIVSSYTCGTVQQLGISSTLGRDYDDSTRQVVDLIRTSLRTDSGDSGAPVYQGARAYGLVVAKDANRYMYFSPISNVMTDMAIRLCLNSSCT